MSATARVAAPRVAAPRVGGAGQPRAKSSAPTPLAVLPSPHAKHGRSVFVAVVATLLVLGLAALLALNTMLAQQAFVVSSLEQRQAALTVTEQALAVRVAAVETPSQLALRARGLGMRPSGTPLFLTLPDGKVLGAGAAGKAKSEGRQP